MLLFGSFFERRSFHFSNRQLRFQEICETKLKFLFTHRISNSKNKGHLLMPSYLNPLMKQKQN
jgi:hypothetical protein